MTAMNLRGLKQASAAVAAVVAIAALATLSACTSGDGESERVTVEVPTTITVTADPTDLPSSFDHYVALGDSYAAMGSATGPFSGPAFCARSDDNYPHQLAEMYPGINKRRGFTDATCQGSTTAHITGDRDTTGEDVPAQVREVTSSAAATSTENTWFTGALSDEPANPAPNVISAQIDALEPDTDLVTLSLGGNDMSFGPWSRCLTGMFTGRGEADCDDGLYDDTARSLVELPTRLDAVYAAIHDKAPDATIITTGYMPLMSMQDECDATADLPGGTLNWAAGLTVTMNAIVRDAAARNGALFVIPPNADFHSVCAPAHERWTDPTGEHTDSFAAHPTAAGQKAMAEAIIEVLKKL